MPLTYTLTRGGKTIFTSDGNAATTNDETTEDTVSKQAALLAKAILKIRAERGGLSPIQSTIY